MSQFKQFRQANRENFHRIWEAAEEGRALTVEEKRFADAIQAHPEYHTSGNSVTWWRLPLTKSMV